MGRAAESRPRGEGNDSSLQLRLSSARGDVPAAGPGGDGVIHE
jgi:hypothetical protein